MDIDKALSEHIGEPGKKLHSDDIIQYDIRGELYNFKPAEALKIIGELAAILEVHERKR